MSSLRFKLAPLFFEYLTYSFLAGWSLFPFRFFVLFIWNHNRALPLNMRICDPPPPKKKTIYKGIWARPSPEICSLHAIHWAALPLSSSSLEVADLRKCPLKVLYSLGCISDAQAGQCYPKSAADMNCFNALYLTNRLWLIGSPCGRWLALLKGWPSPPSECTTQISSKRGVLGFFPTLENRGRTKNCIPIVNTFLF